MRKIVKAKDRKRSYVCSNCHKSGHYISKCKEPCSSCGNTGHTFLFCDEKVDSDQELREQE